MRSGPVPEHESFLSTVLDAVPSMVFVVDDNFVFLHANRAAQRVLGRSSGVVLKRPGGEVLHCLNSGWGASPGEASGCGTTEQCDSCVLRQSSNFARLGTRVERQPYTMHLVEAGAERVVHVQVTATAFDHGGRRLVLLILEDVTPFEELRRIVAVCAWCKKVRQDGDFKGNLETWLARNTEFRVSHGMCPECADKNLSG